MSAQESAREQDTDIAGTQRGYAPALVRPVAAACRGWGCAGPALLSVGPGTLREGCYGVKLTRVFLSFYWCEFEFERVMSVKAICLLHHWPYVDIYCRLTSNWNSDRQYSLRHGVLNRARQTLWASLPSLLAYRPKRYYMSESSYACLCAGMNVILKKNKLDCLLACKDSCSFRFTK